jgi:hypothetical protein
MPTSKIEGRKSCTQYFDIMCALIDTIGSDEGLIDVEKLV